ncbi:MAG: hypothetical protein ACT4NY_07390 [Pseudonocardiales bacterium]
MTRTVTVQNLGVKLHHSDLRTARLVRVSHVTFRYNITDRLTLYSSYDNGFHFMIGQAAADAIDEERAR